MKRLSSFTAWIVLVLFVVSACAVAPKHPALKDASVQDFIPLRHFFINKETTFGFKVSPDGKKLGWIAVEMFQPETNTWDHFLTLNFEDRLKILNFPAGKQELWALSNRGRDRISLVRLNLKNGEEKLVYEDPVGDVGYVVMSQITKAPLIAASFPDYPKLHFFDSTVEADAMVLKDQTPMGMRIQSADHDERIVTVATYTD